MARELSPYSARKLLTQKLVEGQVGASQPSRSRSRSREQFSRNGSERARKEPSIASGRRSRSKSRERKPTKPSSDGKPKDAPVEAGAVVRNRGPSPEPYRKLRSHRGRGMKLLARAAPSWLVSRARASVSGSVIWCAGGVWAVEMKMRRANEYAVCGSDRGWASVNGGRLSSCLCVVDLASGSGLVGCVCPWSDLVSCLCPCPCPSSDRAAYLSNCPSSSPQTYLVSCLVIYLSAFQ